jgi:hypothetical protein
MEKSGIQQTFNTSKIQGKWVADRIQYLKVLYKRQKGNEESKELLRTEIEELGGSIELTQLEKEFQKYYRTPNCKYPVNHKDKVVVKPTLLI